MESIIQINNISQANDLVGKETQHPLVTVIDFSKQQPMQRIKMTMGLYGVFMKVSKESEVQYGRSSYDYQEGTLLAIGPGQVVGLGNSELGETFQPKGWGLMFHPDLLLGTPIGKRIQEYTFFSYSIREALHLSQQEREMVLDCFLKIEQELKRGIDKHSRTIIVSTIELLLNYCTRFYDRQFITRDSVHQGLMEKFVGLLGDYFQSDKPQLVGLPTVGYFAEQLHLSANYFGDLVKRETGKTAQEFIQWKIIEIAKERILDPHKTSSEVAYELGFKYPQHFTRFFKKQMGMTPGDYRESVN